MAYARRVLQSVTFYKPEKAYNGFTLFTPMTPDPSNTWLMDMQGRFVHRWQLPGWVRLRADLLPNGNLLFGLRDPNTGFADMLFAGGVLAEMDWDGNVLWRHADPFMDCHDWIRRKNGNTIYARYVEMPKELAARVIGGYPGTERNGIMYSCVLTEITPGGQVVWEWTAYEHLDPELDGFTPARLRRLWPGFNSLVELPDGNILACSFQTSNLIIIDKATGEIKWRWGQNIISFPHNPSMLAKGNILVLDNGRVSITSQTPDFSRVVEVNPATNQIEWEYKEENPADFYTTYIGGCERLPNGNTLICEGAMGRFFEVASRGEIVWEYVVPFYAEHEEASYGRSNCTYRCHRYGPDYPGLQGKRMDPEKLEWWNRLYGPEAFGPYVFRGGSGGVGLQPTGPEESVAFEYEESRPSVGQPPQEEKTLSRLKKLGY